MKTIVQELICDFQVADKKGEKSIQELFNKCVEEMKENVEDLNYLIKAIDKLVWYHHKQCHTKLTVIYYKLLQSVNKMIE
jgi:hypothetical protein